VSVNRLGGLWAFLLLLLALSNAGCTVFGIRTYETPKYTVVLKEDDKEIRYYEPYIVAKTTVQGDFEGAQGEAFRILAGYIFGGNEKKQEIAMTGPVVQKSTGEGERIPMTGPVTQRRSPEGWVMTFMMPSAYKLEDLPAPKDKRVSLEAVPATYVAAIRYTWLESESRNEAKANELLQWLTRVKGYEAISAPMYAGYDPPWALPFVRRNEVMIELKKAPQ